MKKAEKLLKRKKIIKKFNYIILILGLITFIFIGTLYVLNIFYALNLTGKVETTEIIKVIKPEKPSYEYLKSITVYITGEITETISPNYITLIGQRWSGTGSIIKIDKNYTYILTNAHVAGKGKENVILFVENGLKQIEAQIVAYHQADSIDLAVIKVKGTLQRKREIKGINLAKPQDPVYLVGHHLGRKYVYGEGVFAGYDGIYDIIQIPTLFGNSGSAVINKDGELIGVIFAINTFGFFQVDSAHGLAIDGLSVKLFLQKLGLYNENY